jgi:hypothetical protein
METAALPTHHNSPIFSVQLETVTASPPYLTLTNCQADTQHIITHSLLNLILDNKLQTHTFT